MHHSISDCRDSPRPGSTSLTPSSTILGAAPHPLGQHCQTQAICLHPQEKENNSNSTATWEGVLKQQSLTGLTFIRSASLHCEWLETQA